ncbi:MAG: hypothetical protein ACE366_23565 [Bradymonadia bacterium]
MSVSSVYHFAALALSAGLAFGCEATPDNSNSGGNGPNNNGAIDLDCPLDDLGPEGSLRGEIPIFGRVVNYSYTIEDGELATVIDEEGRTDRCNLVADEAVGGGQCEDQYRCASCDVLIQQAEDGQWYLALVGFQAGCERYRGSLLLTPDE